jgi:hypothetical protein
MMFGRVLMLYYDVKHTIPIIALHGIFLLFYRFVEFIKIINVKNFFYVHQIILLPCSTISLTSVTGPYWWHLFIMCRAKADSSLLSSDVSYVFFVPR